jgi:type IV secretory pathway protease TraF
MLPKLTPGQRVRVRRKPPAAVRAGDVVLAEAPRPRTYQIIKRAVAVPGDPAPDGRGEVPPGMYVLLGDNSAASFDSRHFGYLPARHILGVVSGR